MDIPEYGRHERKLDDIVHNPGADEIQDDTIMTPEEFASMFQLFAKNCVDDMKKLGMKVPRSTSEVEGYDVAGLMRIQAGHGFTYETFGVFLDTWMAEQKAAMESLNK